jgi:hypothetical protein
MNPQLPCHCRLAKLENAMSLISSVLSAPKKRRRKVTDRLSIVVRPSSRRSPARALATPSYNVELSSGRSLKPPLEMQKAKLK